MAFKLLSLAALLLCAAPLINATVWNISVADNVFVPATLQIAVNDTVHWIWTGAHPHTVTQGQGTSGCTAQTPGFATATLTGAGNTFNQTFTANANIYYYCAVHCAGGMVATITVGTGTPTTPPVTTTTTPRVPVTHTVQVGAGGLVFSPASLTILQFDSVAFTLASGTHNVQSIPSAGSCTAVATNAAIFSGTTPLAGTYTVQFNTTGQFPYMCSYHCASGMVGTINVVQTLPAPAGNGAQAAQSAVASILILAIALSAALMQRA
jgi:plastocyanin